MRDLSEPILMIVRCLHDETIWDATIELHSGNTQFIECPTCRRRYFENNGNYIADRLLCRRVTFTLSGNTFTGWTHSICVGKACNYAKLQVCGFDPITGGYHVLEDSAKVLVHVASDGIVWA